MTKVLDSHVEIFEVSKSSVVEGNFVVVPQKNKQNESVYVPVFELTNFRKEDSFTDDSFLVQHIMEDYIEANPLLSKERLIYILHVRDTNLYGIVGCSDELNVDSI